MSRTHAVGSKPSAMSRALARDRVGIPSVLAFILASIAPMTVCAGVIPTAYAVTGLTGIPFAVIAVAAVLVLFTAGYVVLRSGVNVSSCAVALRPEASGAGTEEAGQVVMLDQNSTRNFGVKVAVVGRMPAIRSSR